MTYPDVSLSNPWSHAQEVDEVALYNGTTAELNLLVPRVSDSGWITPTLAGAWVAAAVGTAPVTAQYRLKGGVVFLQGQVKSGTGTIFTLPAGYRPLHDKYWIGFASPGTVELAVFATGVVTVGFYFNSGTNAQVALDPIAFIQEQ